MQSDLEMFMAGRLPDSQDVETWGEIRLSISGYLTQDIPPDRLITSVRCVILNQDKVMVVQNPDGYRVLLGGRRETGESFVETLRREVLEETGWSVREPLLLGFLQFHHLTPKPVDYLYPYPDFLQLVFAAEADQHEPEKRIEDDYETDPTFYVLTEAFKLPLPARDRMFLEAAVRKIGKNG